MATAEHALRRDVERGERTKESRWALSVLVTGIVLLKLLEFAVAWGAVRAEPVGRFATGWPLVAWDSRHYQEILTEGYPPPSKDGSVPWGAGFFPLYPLSAWWGAWSGTPELALLLAANAAGLAGFVMFFRWCERVTGDARVALLACGLLAAYPPAMFFTAAYSEGLFLLLTSVALWGCAARRYWLAAVAVGLATATRPTGVALLPVLLLMVLRDSAYDWRRPATWGALAGMAIVGSCGLLAFAAYEQTRYGDPFAYVHAQAAYGVGGGAAGGAKSRHAGEGGHDRLIVAAATPLERVVQKLTSPGAWNRVLALGGLAVWLVSLPYAARRMPWPYLLLPVLIFALGYLPGMGVRITSIARFMTAALPLFLVAALAIERWPRVVVEAVCVGGVAVQLVYVWIFTRGGWCG